jgi:hypothetical protein
MKFKALSFLAIALSAIMFMACNDDIDSIGSSIQPDGDGIFVGTDTLTVTAETVSFKDSVYARTIYSMLGEYIDPVFGKVKSDYMCEFFMMDTIKAFQENVVSIDSVFMETGFSTFTGDSISPMGVAVYEVTSPLKPFFFTSVDPKNYCDMNTLLGQSIFSIQNLPDTAFSSSYRTKRILTKVGVERGQKIYNEWQNNRETFKNPDNFKEFFKGVYITSTFGSGSMINVDYNEFNIYYTYNVRNTANTADSAVAGLFSLPVTPEVIQMNSIKNTLPEDLFTSNKTKTYMKTPAGVYTKLTLPLNDIVNKAGKGRTLNSANLKIKGFTEEEEKLNITRPTYVLLLNKDSLENFFYKSKKPDNITSFVITRTTTASSTTPINTYDLGNIATVINHYADYYKDRETLPDLEYLMIPVTVKTTTSSSTGTTSIAYVYNIMSQTSAILRTDPDNMKFSIIYSKYNNNKE